MVRLGEHPPSTEELELWVDAIAIDSQREQQRHRDCGDRGKPVNGRSVAYPANTDTGQCHK